MSMKTPFLALYPNRTQMLALLSERAAGRPEVNSGNQPQAGSQDALARIPAVEEPPCIARLAA